MEIQEFEWHAAKALYNLNKHGVSFHLAREAFNDPFHVIIEDSDHSAVEERYYCLGMVEGKVMTVRFTMREKKIRIIGAAYWREGRWEYEKQNRLGRL